MANAHDIIIKPVLTEKSYDMIANKTYTFIVDKRATKPAIARALEEIFGIKVARVNTLNSEGKLKRQGRTQGRRPDTKKAFVTLKPDSKGIEFFDSMSN